jgi:hypothetical protein
MNNPRRKRSGYQGIVSIRRKRRGIYPKRLKRKHYGKIFNQFSESTC